MNQRVKAWSDGQCDTNWTAQSAGIHAMGNLNSYPGRLAEWITANLEVGCPQIAGVKKPSGIQYLHFGARRGIVNELGISYSLIAIFGLR